MAKTFIGGRLRRLRADRELSQAQLARVLDLSTSYVNQLENDQRPATVPVLMKLTAAFDVDAHYFAATDDARMVTALRQLFHDHPELGDVPDAEVQELVSRMPTVARALLAASRTAPAAETAAATAFEQVRDYFYDRDNHIAALDDAAERLFVDESLEVGNLDRQLADLLQRRWGITVSVDAAPHGDATLRRRFDPENRVLALATHLTAGQRAFELATQVAYLGYSQLITEAIGNARGLSADAQRLTRVGLANYFAGALILPYRTFLTSAEGLRYDIDALAREFGTGFETVCHRLSTLQRPGHRGVPFFLVRADRAGNISKRQSATAFHFSRGGGSCPLWVLHDAFSTPGRLRRQIAEMPDGRTYLWIARTTNARGSGFLGPERTFSVALGCDIVHASRLVYAAGLNVRDRSVAVPIGPGCRSCERIDCHQRAFPLTGRELTVSDNVSSVVPYI